MRFVRPLSAALLVAACQVDAVVDLQEDPPLPACLGIVDGGGVRFDAVDLSVGQTSSSASVTISSDCGGVLEIGSMGIEGRDGAAFDGLDPGIIRLEPGESWQVELVFRPATAGDFEAELVLDSNDAEAPTRRVALAGIGLAPVIELDHYRYDFGAPHVGCESERPVEIRNRGNVDLDVLGVALSTASVAEFELDLNSVGNGPRPWTLPPYDPARGGPSVVVYLDYVALDTFADSALLSIWSTDPARPEVWFEATATGTPSGMHTDVFRVGGSSGSDATFPLTREPVPRLIEVRVDGVRTTRGWSYAPRYNAVVFDASSRPSEGSTVRIDYVLRPDCDG